MSRDVSLNFSLRYKLNLIMRFGIRKEIDNDDKF